MNKSKAMKTIAAYQNNPVIMRFVISEAIKKANGDNTKLGAYIAAGLVGCYLAAYGGSIQYIMFFGRIVVLDDDIRRGAA